MAREIFFASCCITVNTFLLNKADHCELFFPFH